MLAPRVHWCLPLYNCSVPVALLCAREGAARAGRPPELLFHYDGDQWNLIAKGAVRRNGDWLFTVRRIGPRELTREALAGFTCTAWSNGVDDALWQALGVQVVERPRS